MASAIFFFFENGTKLSPLLYQVKKILDAEFMVM
jgi:hypothetical protein